MISWSLLLLAGFAQSPTSAFEGAVEHVSPWIENLGQWPAEVLFVSDVDGGFVRAQSDGLWFQARDSSGLVEVIHLDLGLEESEFRGSGIRGATHSYFRGSDPSRWVSAAPSYASVSCDGGLHAAVIEGTLTLTGVELAELEAAGATSDESAGRIATVEGQVRDHLIRIRPDGPGFTSALEGVGSSVVLPDWSTFVGGHCFGVEVTDASAVGPNGRLAVLVSSRCEDFPTTPGLHYGPGSTNEQDDMHLAVFETPNGRLAWAARIGGSAGELSLSLAIADDGRVAFGGNSPSDDWPLAGNVLDTALAPAVSKSVYGVLSPDGSDLLVCSYLGFGAVGTVSALAFSPQGDLALAGQDGPFTTPNLSTYVGADAADPIGATLNQDNEGYALVLDGSDYSVDWATYIGGDGLDEVKVISFGADGLLTVAGETTSNPKAMGVENVFPTTPGAYVDNNTPNEWDLFVARINQDGTAFEYSAFIAGNDRDAVLSLDVANDGSAILAGGTGSSDLPVTAGVVDPVFTDDPGSPFQEAYFIRLNPAGSQIDVCTYLGSIFDTEFIYGVSVDASGLISFTAHIDASDAFMDPGVDLSPTEWFGVEQKKGTMVGLLTPDATELLYSVVISDGTTASLPRGGGRLPDGSFAVGGTAFTPAWPTTPGAFDPIFGGVYDGYALKVDLLPTGARRVGDSSSGCIDSPYLGTVGLPRPGNQDFDLFLSCAPTDATALLAIGKPALEPVTVAGIPVHVDLAAPYLVVPWETDERGFARRDLAIPAVLGGSDVAIQAFIPSTCPDAPPIQWTHQLELSFD